MKLETCERCGAKVTSLHSGGDAAIPEPGVCDGCAAQLWTAIAPTKGAHRSAKSASYDADNYPQLKAATGGSP